MALTKPPYRRRTFAHILGVDLACPSCGTIHTQPPMRPRVIYAKKARMYSKPGYHPTTGRFKCRVCQKSYVLGVIFWPLGQAGNNPGRPMDTVPTLEEAIVLRECASRLMAGRVSGTTQEVNVLEDQAPDPEPLVSPIKREDPLI